MLKISKDLKFFLIILVAFIASHFIYNNFVQNSIAKGITFRDVKVEVIGEIQLELSCKGNVDKNPPEVKRGVGEKTNNKCSGTGKFKAILPQQRFVDNPSIGN